MTNNQLQAIFFDFDGVIIDSNSTKTEAFRTLFSGYNEQIIDAVVAHHRQHGGISRVEKIRFAHEHIIGQPLTDEQLARWAQRYSELVVEKVIAVPWVAGAKDFLDSIRGSLPVFVISGTPEDELRRIIDRREMTGYFQEILGSPIRKPDHVRNLLTGYRLIPECCLFVGDALADYQAAMDTGLHFIGIRGEVPFPATTLVMSDCRGLQKAVSQIFLWKTA